MRAWVTLLSQPDYFIGVQTLQKSLRLSNTLYPLLVMVTPDITPSMHTQLTDAGCEVIEVAPLMPPLHLHHHYACAHFAEVWTKLRIWQLGGYQRVVFLDADMLVVENMDEMMQIPLPEKGIAACHACRCNPQKLATYPASWQPENCYYSWQDRQQPPPTQLDAYFNAGFLVLKPDAEIFRQLEERIAAITDLSRYAFSEQDLLNEYFADRWQALPFTYNALKTLSVQHVNTWRSAPAKNIHFILTKPWQRAGQPHNARQDNCDTLDALWWHIFER